METKERIRHTPGPWRIFPDSRHDGYWISDDSDQGDLSHLALVVCHDDFDGETLANARLIASAPELLAALQRLLRAGEADYELCPTMDVATAFETNSQAVKQARAAIAKATQS